MRSAKGFWNSVATVFWPYFPRVRPSEAAGTCSILCCRWKLFAVTFFCSSHAAWALACTASTATLCAVNVRLQFRDLTCSCPSDSLNIFSHRRSATSALSSRWGSLLTFGHLCSSRRSAHGRVKIRSASSSSLIYCSIPLSRYKTCLSAVSDRNALRRV